MVCCAVEKKFKSKTGNKWGDRGSFVPKKNLYTLLDMADDVRTCVRRTADRSLLTNVTHAQDDDEEELRAALEALDGDDAAAGPSSAPTVEPCSLPATTQKLLRLITDDTTFMHAMGKMDIDTKKLPLGKLSTKQVDRGFEILSDIEDVIEGNKSRARLAELCSEFYTVIPHAFGRRQPPLIADRDTVQKKCTCWCSFRANVWFLRLMCPVGCCNWCRAPQSTC